LPALLWNQQQSSAVRSDRQHPPGAHRRPERKVKKLASGQGVGSGAGWLAPVEGPLRRTQIDR
jgi:hypothetical protein